MGSSAVCSPVGTGGGGSRPSTQGWGKSGTLPVFLSCPAPSLQPLPSSYQSSPAQRVEVLFWVEKPWPGSRAALFTKNHANHRSNFKFSSSYIKKQNLQLILIVYLFNQYIQNIIFICSQF